MRRGFLGLAALWLALAGAAPAPTPLVPPPPDLTRLVPFATAPLEKPLLALPELPLPAPPVDLPSLPPAPAAGPADKPTAFLPAPRALPCVGAWLRIASESLECGRARFGKGEYEDAARALEQAVRAGTEREFLNEARYWLAETLFRLGRMEQADWLFRQVAQESPRGELGVFASHSSGWSALALGDGARARQTFTQLLAGPLPAPLDVWGRHGQALAEYALGRYDEAYQAWVSLASHPLPAALGRDILFWVGESAGRVGKFERAADDLARFRLGGSHPLAETAVLHLGWWSLAAGRVKESLEAFRAYLGAPVSAGTAGAAGRAPERDWAEAGLAVALAASGDDAAARNAVHGLRSRHSPLVEPVLLRLTRIAVEAGHPAATRPLVQELLGTSLTPPVRAWVLLTNGEADRQDADRDDARTQYELAQRTDPTSPTGWYAALRLAQTNFELREFAQAAGDLKTVLAAPISPELRSAALLLQGEAAYHAGDHATAGTAFRRMLVEFPQHALARAARLGVAWAALRQGRGDEARREFVEFARSFTDDANAPDALVLASELALAAGDSDGARALLDQVIATYPTHARTEFARLNRAILMIHAGDGAAARQPLQDWIARAPFQPLLGRAHAALGVALLAGGRAAEAAKEFTAAEREGVGALASLGLGAIALQQAQWDAAKARFSEARDTGTPAVAAAAEYGLAAVAFTTPGAVREFQAPARAELSRSPGAPSAPRLLYVLTGIAVETKDWKDAMATANRLVTEFPADDTAADALVRVGAGAAAGKAWPVAYEALASLARRYPKSPFVPGSRLLLAEAELETGRAAEARPALEQLVTATTDDAGATRTLLLLARAREATGDRPGALDAYARASREGIEWPMESLFGHARLLAEEGRWDQARVALRKLLKSPDASVVADAASGIGEAYQREGQYLDSAEYYMTAAYLAPSSAAGQRALLGAARSFVALKQPDAAAIAYRKLLAQPDVPAALAAAARQGLAELARP